MLDCTRSDLALAVEQLHNAARVLFNVGVADKDVLTQKIAVRILSITAEWLGRRGIDA